MAQRVATYRRALVNASGGELLSTRDVSLTDAWDQGCSRRWSRACGTCLLCCDVPAVAPRARRTHDARGRAGRQFSERSRGVTGERCMWRVCCDGRGCRCASVYSVKYICKNKKSTARAGAALTRPRLAAGPPAPTPHARAGAPCARAAPAAPGRGGTVLRERAKSFPRSAAQTERRAVALCRR